MNKTLNTLLAAAMSVLCISAATATPISTDGSAASEISNGCSPATGTRTADAPSGKAVANRSAGSNSDKAASSAAGSSTEKTVSSGSAGASKKSKAASSSAEKASTTSAAGAEKTTGNGLEEAKIKNPAAVKPNPKAKNPAKVGETKIVDSFDKNSWPLTIKAEEWCPYAGVRKRVDEEDFVEGNASILLEYSFSGKATARVDTANQAATGNRTDTETETANDQAAAVNRTEVANGRTNAANNQTTVATTELPAPEQVYMLRRFGNWRCDFSFCPYGLSIWVKGKAGNPGELRMVLLQDSELGVGQTTVRQTYQCPDKSGAIRKGRWTRLIFPFNEFTPLDAAGTPLDLSKVIGYRIEIVNTEGKAGSGEVHFDLMEQLTTYRPEWNKKAKFSSVFLQISPAYAKTDFDKMMAEGKKIGIDTWILQYCIGHKKLEHCAYYKNCSLPWITERYDIADRMFAAAEKAGCKIVVGPYFQYWGDTDISKRTRYAEMLENNKLVIDELADNFASSPAFAGWYIADEFHDGSARANANWHRDSATEQLAWYLEENARYMKSKKDVPVCVAPALWKGRPAKMTGDLFGRLFARTPDVDILYLQDCCGRGPDSVMSVGVDLPNYYAEIKKACDANGVKFGVDIESFFRCNMFKMPRRQKTWDELSRQLWMAGQFTDYITTFSWASFKPGYRTYEGYRAYLKSIE